MENYESKLEAIIKVNKEIENYVASLERNLQNLREEYTTFES